MSQSDPFTSTAAIVARLHKEYAKHDRLIVAVDFDDTVFDFHAKTASHSRVLQTLRRCNSVGFYIVVWTASAPERFNFIQDYMGINNVHIDAINENPIKLPFGNHKKIYYNILLDDRAGLGQALDALEILLNDIEQQTNNTNE